MTLTAEYADCCIATYYAALSRQVESKSLLSGPFVSVLLVFGFLPITQPRSSKQTPVVGSCFHGQSSHAAD